MEWIVAGIAVGLGILILVIGILMGPIRSDRPYRKPRKTTENGK